MFVNLRKFRKCKIFQLTVTWFVLSMTIVCWEDLDERVVSHLKSYLYRYLINNYSFINSSFFTSQEKAQILNTYPYLINNEHKCEKEDVLLLLFVKSSPNNVDRRHSIRLTWGNEMYILQTLGVRMRVVFALGVHEQHQQRGYIQRELISEARRYKDLVQQDFADTFHNLTVKLVLQFQWAYTYCRQARFVMSTDDDMFIHMPNLVHYLQGLSSRDVHDLWVGRVHKGSPPVRHRKSKYYVPYEMYPWISYPDYTAGAAYVVSRDIMHKIYQATMTLHTTLPIDDVFMGIFASTIGVSPQDHAYFSGEGKAPYHPCIYDKMITSHGHVSDIHYLWKISTSPQNVNVSTGLMGKLYCTVMKAVLLCKPYSTYSCIAAFS
ncbi:lactosylceramide 1,3-N-acetyl-beta-D-glucosaminyltransferase A [Paramormyrops kingsleyae]|uniref:Hexosyltransferase n=1 Tax=Paramormyrops kingsleyae TaxID=1676925 RepID=A0A3B3QNC0_9TELE|nr:lactosylceramide 1,3-N-acetyl-beta-D-glucosaminyltransferase A-like [Paramormyrops kingsleyae]